MKLVKYLTSYSVLCFMMCSVFSCSPVMKKSKTVMFPPVSVNDQNSSVTFICTTGEGGTPIVLNYGIWDRENFVGVLGPKSYISYITEPGEHLFMVRRLARWFYIKANLEAGKNYYLIAEVKGQEQSISPITRNVHDIGEKEVYAWMRKLSKYELNEKRVDDYVKPRIYDIKYAIEKFEKGEVADVQEINHDDFLPRDPE